ncbi:hypothetical protein GCM10027047_16750 [Rhodococcus aerolatus]
MVNAAATAVGSVRSTGPGAAPRGCPGVPVATAGGVTNTDGAPDAAAGAADGATAVGVAAAVAGTGVGAVLVQAAARAAVRASRTAAGPARWAWLRGVTGGLLGWC